MTTKAEAITSSGPLDRPRDRPRVVIIGAGFAGLNAAKKLRKCDVEVVLIDRENYHLFQPLLYQVATAGLQAGDIASPIRGLMRRQKNAMVIRGEVESIDRDGRRVIFDRGEIDYDYLVVAAGTENNYFGNSDWALRAPGLKTMGDAMECRRRILDAFERAEWTDDEELTEALLTFVIVGAGPTGVEMAGAIREIAHEVMVRDFRNIDLGRARVILVDAGPRVLTGYSEESSQRALQDLESMGVEVRLNAMVDEISDEGVQMGDEFITTSTVIWAAGVRASPVVESLDAEVDGMGRVKVTDELRVPGDDRIFVLGDLVHLEVDGNLLPGLAPVAIQQGRHTARNIHRLVEGEEAEPFEFRDRGQMATIGRARAIAEIGRWKFSGFVAWLLWLFVHLLFLIGFRNRIFVVLDWFYAYVGMKRSGRLILDTPEAYRDRQRRQGAERGEQDAPDTERADGIDDGEEWRDQDLEQRGSDGIGDEVGGTGDEAEGDSAISGL